MENKEELWKFYGQESPEELRLREDGPQYLEYLTATRYLEGYLPGESKVLDSCAGTGIYAFRLAEQGHKVTAGDLVRRNVALMKAQQEKTPKLAEIYEGSALDLSRFEDGAFDAVLCMGALYHLHSPGEREQCVREGMRVLRPGGLFIATYMNRYSVILNNSRDDLPNLDEILLFAREGREGVFHASTPEETGALMEHCGLEPRCHLALDGMAWFLYGTAGLLNAEGFRRWWEYHLAVCEVPSLLGSSYHNMYIGQKQG